MALKVLDIRIGLSESNFSSTKMFFPTYVLCSLKLFKLKTEGQTI